MKKLIVALSIIIFMLMPARVLAQTDQDPKNYLEEVDQNVVYQPAKDLELELVQKVQNPGDNTIRFDLIIKPSFNSDRVNLTWLVTGPAILDDGEVEQTITLSDGQNQDHFIVIEPKGYGVVKVRALVEAFTVDGTRTSIASQNLITDEEGKLLIVSQGQQVANTFYLIRNIAAVALGVFFFLLLVLAIFRLGKNWWNNDKI